MELSRFTDYTLRTLIYAGLHPGRTITVPEVAAAYGISENHVGKVMHRCGQLAILKAKRGRHGGYLLARPPEEIRIGDVVRATESLDLIECRTADGGSCPIASACVLKRVIGEAAEAFVATFDRYTLADLLGSGAALRRALAPSAATG